MDLLAVASVFAVVWSTRYRYDPPGTAIDLKLFILFWIGVPRQDTQYSTNEWRWRSHFLLKGYCCLQCACCLSLSLSNIFLVPQVYRKRQENRIEIEELEAKVKRLQWELDNGRHTSEHDFGPLKPILFPCRTSHTRLFPQKHSFSYSYLFVGIPVGWRGWISSLLTADLKTLPWRGRTPKIGWFNVDSADHLARGDSMHGLRGKLDTYLESQNELVKDYPHAYLVTAPRFLGYSFNPVSFWYLYNGREELKAMILEVNNTFDERRMYFLKDLEPKDGIFRDKEGNLVPGDESHDGCLDRKFPVQRFPVRFASSWEKDFHVSPFNSRKGGYSLSAVDPFFPCLSSGAGSALVNNVITLNSSKQHPKLVARVTSSSDSIDPYKLKGWGTLKFIAAWWWVGFVTFPRIVREAGKLFFRRKLHVWYRPEVLKDSIGRNETEDEKAVAIIFQHFLRTTVEKCESPFALKFLPGIATMDAEEVFKPHALHDESDKQQSIVTLKITTPLFYAQNARSTSIWEYVKTALSEPDSGSATFYISHPDLLMKLFEESDSISKSTGLGYRRKSASTDKHVLLPNGSVTAPTSQYKPSPWKPLFLTADKELLNRLRWLPIHLLRQLSSDSHNYTYSNLDATAMHLTQTNAPAVRAYRRSVLKLLISDYVAFGMPNVIDMVLWVVRIWLCWLCVGSFDGMAGLWDAYGQGRLSVSEVGKVMMGFMGVHFWWGLGDVL